MRGVIACQPEGDDFVRGIIACEDDRGAALRPRHRTQHRDVGARRIHDPLQQVPTGMPGPALARRARAVRATRLAVAAPVRDHRVTCRTRAVSCGHRPAQSPRDLQDPAVRALDFDDHQLRRNRVFG